MSLKAETSRSYSRFEKQSALLHSLHYEIERELDRQVWDELNAPPRIEHQGQQIPLPGVCFHEPDTVLRGVALGPSRVFHEVVPDYSRVVMVG